MRLAVERRVWVYVPVLFWIGGIMLRLSKRAEGAVVTPFRTGEEAWFWTVAALTARRDGAGAAWQPPGPVRPCEPDDVIKCLDTLYQRGSITLRQARILRIWGERQVAPDATLIEQSGDHQAWQRAMAQLEWGLRGRGIVR